MVPGRESMRVLPRLPLFWTALWRLLLSASATTRRQAYISRVGSLFINMQDSSGGQYGAKAAVCDKQRQKTPPGRCGKTPYTQR